MLDLKPQVLPFLDITSSIFALNVIKFGVALLPGCVLPCRMDNLIDDIQARLQSLKKQNLLRRRRVVEGPQGPSLHVDGEPCLAFCSNDYLGLANHPALIAAAHAGLDRFGVGASASALLSGHSRVVEELETALAAFVGMPAALCFSNGYMANMGVIPALVGPGDAIFSDSLNHACLIDGARLSKADVSIYEHADMDRLEALLAKDSSRRKLILSDGVFSMDGDIAPLPDLVALCERYNAWLLLDDAHGFGVLGPQGRGSLAHFGLASRRVLYMGTLGKAAGVAGAFVAGDATLIQWLLQRARTYVFTTASPPLLGSALMAALVLLESGDARQLHLRALIGQLRDGLADLPWRLLPSETAVQALIVKDNGLALELMQGLREQGIWVPAIRPPTVPENTARLRISLSAAHTSEQVDRLIVALKTLAAKHVKAPSAWRSDMVGRSLKSVWHPCTQMQHHTTVPMVPVSHGRGAWLYGDDGKRYLDAISSWWVNLFGHANPRINARIKEQLDTLPHAMLAGFTHEPVIRLSELLAAKTGHALGHCFYASDGASAVEIALKMSFHAWRNAGHAAKQEFVCLKGSYHGETIGALAVTDVSLFRDAYGPLLRPVHVVMSPDARAAQDGETAADVARRAALALEALLRRRAEHIAAVIIEPLVQCAAGMVMHDPVYLSAVRALCDRYQVHLIFDEIAVGCGRSGTFFASEQAAGAGGAPVWPDLVCLSKGISGGYLPLSLVMATDAIYQAFYDTDVKRGFLHSHSYTGNPLACRAALATLEIFEQDDVLNANRRRAQRITAALTPLAHHPQVRHFRQRGMIWAFDAAISDSAAADFSQRFFAKALESELLLRPIGRTVYLMPPYILDDAECDLLAARTAAVFESVIHHG